jgi:hypothetical protein
LHLNISHGVVGKLCKGPESGSECKGWRVRLTGKNVHATTTPPRSSDNNSDANSDISYDAAYDGDVDDEVQTTAASAGTMPDHSEVGGVSTATALDPNYNEFLTMSALIPINTIQRLDPSKSPDNESGRDSDERGRSPEASFVCMRSGSDSGSDSGEVDEAAEAFSAVGDNGYAAEKLDDKDGENYERDNDGCGFTGDLTRVNEHEKDCSKAMRVVHKDTDQKLSFKSTRACTRFFMKKFGFGDDKEDAQYNANIKTVKNEMLEHVRNGNPLHGWVLSYSHPHQHASPSAQAPVMKEIEGAASAADASLVEPDAQAQSQPQPQSQPQLGATELVSLTMQLGRQEAGRTVNQLVADVNTPNATGFDAFGDANNDGLGKALVEICPTAKQWMCSVCTLENKTSVLQCESCAEERGSTTAPPEVRAQRGRKRTTFLAPSSPNNARAQEYWADDDGDDERVDGSGNIDSHREDTCEPVNLPIPNDPSSNPSSSDDDRDGGTAADKSWPASNLKPGEVVDDPKLKRRLYMSQNGETIRHIARKFGATPRQLMQDNWGRYPDLRVHITLKEGTLIILPLDGAKWVKVAQDADKEYCICGGDEFGEMMQCGGDCQEWFHISCLKISKAEAERLENFNCKLCTEYEKHSRWPDEIENALYSGHSTIKMKHPHRHQLIADLIFRKTGKIVSATQVKHRLKRAGGLPQKRRREEKKASGADSGSNEDEDETGSSFSPRTKRGGVALLIPCPNCSRTFKRKDSLHRHRVRNICNLAVDVRSGLPVAVQLVHQRTGKYGETFTSQQQAANFLDFSNQLISRLLSGFEKSKVYKGGWKVQPRAGTHAARSSKDSDDGSISVGSEMSRATLSTHLQTIALMATPTMVLFPQTMAVQC